VLTRLDLSLFKCFEKLELPLAPLTLLSGVNASGKSSVLQALVLLNQTMREHEWSTRLMLNGNLMQLGLVADIVDSIHGRKVFSMGVHDESESFRWRFAGERNEMSMAVAEVRSEGKVWSDPDQLRYLAPIGHDRRQHRQPPPGLPASTRKLIPPQQSPPNQSLPESDASAV